MRNAFAEQLAIEAERDERIILLAADISPAAGFDRLIKERPKQFLNVGVAEQAMVGIAAGLAIQGYRPFCYSIAPFALERPWEFVRDDLSYQNLPVTIVGMGAGAAYATLGGTHQAICDVALASALPNMTVLAPCDPYETRECTSWCAREATGPVYLRLGKHGERSLTQFFMTHPPAPCVPWVFGEPHILWKGWEDTHLAILTYGPIASLAMDLNKQLKKPGAIYSVHTLKPVSPTLEKIIEHFPEIITIEEHVGQGGLGQQIRALSDDNVGIHCFHLEDRWSACHGTRDEYLAEHGLTVESILSRL